MTRKRASPACWMTARLAPGLQLAQLQQVELGLQELGLQETLEEPLVPQVIGVALLQTGKRRKALPHIAQRRRHRDSVGLDLPLPGMRMVVHQLGQARLPCAHDGGAMPPLKAMVEAAVLLPVQL